MGAHWQRFRRGIALLGLEPMPQREHVESLVHEATVRAGLDPGGRHPDAEGALRLSLSRGDGGRGLSSPAVQRPRLWLQLTPWNVVHTPVHVITSRCIRRAPRGAFDRCKLMGYTEQVVARREAERAGVHDALIPELSGKRLSCATAATLVVGREGNWSTPPLSDGCLDGVMRRQLLVRSWVHEASVTGEETTLGGYLINSLGLRPIASVDGKACDQVISLRQAAALFNSLLEPRGPFRRSESDPPLPD